MPNLLNKIQQLLSGTVKQPEITGTVQDEPVTNDIVWPKNVMIWDDNKESLETFINRRIRVGYPTGRRKVY